MIPVSHPNHDLAAVAFNLRRLMARDGLTFDEVVEATGLDERTLRALVRGANHPQARTLHKLAQGLGVEIDELFRPPGRCDPRRFDRAANALVEAVVVRHANTFENWTEAEFDELFSRFGTGGPLTEAGVLAAAQKTNARRELWRKVTVILESGEEELLTQLVALLYSRATAQKQPECPSRS